MLRLDPQGRHAEYGSPTTVADLKALWTTVETIRRDNPPRSMPTALYPLAAAAKLQEKQEGQQAQMMRMMMWRNDMGPNSEKVPATPGKAIAAHPTVQLLAGIIQLDLQMEGNQ